MRKFSALSAGLLILGGFLAGCSDGETVQNTIGETSNVTASSDALSVQSVLPADIQGKWALVYDESLSLQAICNDPDGKGVFLITGDRIDGYELGIKALNASVTVGTPEGDQWQVLVSMDVEGELISDTLTILKDRTRTLSIVGKYADFRGLQKCG